MQIKKAVKSQAKLRLAIDGPSGSGKTFSALAIGTGLLEPGQKLGVIDTERGSASLYADKFGFDVIELDNFHPQKYIDAIKLLSESGYSVIVVDSLSHAWAGKDGALDLKDAIERRGKGNSYTAWRDITPIQTALVDSLLQCPVHLLATMRTKTEYALETNDKGKQVPKKIGMAPVQRDGIEYEFTVVGDMDQSHHMTVTKSRCAALADKVFEKPGADVAKLLKDWLSEGTPQVIVPPYVPEPQLNPILTEILAAADSKTLLAIADKLRPMPEGVEKNSLRTAFLARQSALTKGA